MKRSREGRPTAEAGSNTRGRERYSATVEKGPAVWKQEWSGFISGVKMTDQGRAVKLPSCMDFEQTGSSTFSYLFSSPAEKKAARDAKKKEEERLRKERMLANRRAGMSEFEGDDRSKMQRAVEDAQVKGLTLEGMNRKQKREMMRLTKTEAQALAEEHQQETKPHELMDPLLAWYQQGPYPIDEIAEKLVIKKAAKKVKQLGLRYNSLTVHPSWLAVRQAKRRYALTVPMGQHTHFDDAGTAVSDAEKFGWSIPTHMVTHSEH